MEVILLKDMEKLGYANDIVNVKPGYANNYLIPQGYAKAATASAKKVLAENLKQRAHKDAKILADAQALAEKIASRVRTQDCGSASSSRPHQNTFAGIPSPCEEPRPPQPAVRPKGSIAV